MSFEEQMRSGMIMAGTPKTVLPRIRHLLEETRPGIMAVWAQDGKVSQKDSLRCIELLGTEVFPQVREWAKELDLKSPFEAELAGALQLFERSDEAEEGRRRVGARSIRHPPRLNAGPAPAHPASTEIDWLRKVSRTHRNNMR